MTNSAALAAGASADVVLGIVAVVVIVRSSLRAARSVRNAYTVLALGFGLGAVSLATTAIWIGVAGVHVLPLIPLELGLSVQAGALVIGVLRLSTIVDGPGSIARRGADGLVLASSGAYALWMLAIEPAPIHYVSGQLSLGGKTVGLLILTPSAVALCICATVSWRARRREPGPLVAMIAGSIAAAALLWLSIGFRNVVVISAAAGLYSAAIVAVMLLLRNRDRLTPNQSAASGTLIGWLPVSVAIIACVIHLAIFRRADNTSILIATVIGAALAGRQTVAVRDLRASAAELARREALYRTLAHTDPLTDLANRRALVQILAEQVIGGPPSVLLAIDLDGFKNINDLRGHDVGDAVLIEVARRLRSNLRLNDIAARLGGDEFAVVLWLHPEEAVAAAARLRAVLARPYDVDGATGIYLSASIGMAPCAGISEVPTIMRNADLALRFAKLRGKDRVEGYAEAFTQWMRRRTTISEELRGAIGRSELSVFYQPVVSLPGGTVVGAEAQVRWHHPHLGMVPAAEFIPIAEDSGLIHDIGRWLMGEACRQLVRWTVDGHQPWVAVNVSVRELHQPTYVADVADVIGTHRLPSGRLILEVTEHAVALDVDELVAVLATLRAIGVRIALDDFGSGLSALGQLSRLPIDILRVDASIIATAAESRRRDAGPLADVVVRLGQRLGLDVVAVGVADAEQRRVVSDAGCVLVQGDFFGAAVPAEHLEARMDAEATSLVPAPRQATATSRSNRKGRRF